MGRGRGGRIRRTRNRPKNREVAREESGRGWGTVGCPWAEVQVLMNNFKPKVFGLALELFSTAVTFFNAGGKMSPPHLAAF